MLPKNSHRVFSSNLSELDTTGRLIVGFFLLSFLMVVVAFAHDCGTEVGLAVATPIILFFGIVVAIQNATDDAHRGHENT